MPDQPYTIADMRREMGRLVQVMLAKNAHYLRREAELVARYGHDKLVLQARLDDDYQLNHASASAKTCAMLVTGIASAIAAEIAYAEHQTR